MKKNNLIKGAAVLGTIALMTGGVLVADAAVDRSTNKLAFKGQVANGNQPMMFGLSETERVEKLNEITARRDEHRLVAQQRQTEMTAKRSVVWAALEAVDYEAWKIAIGNHPLAEKITADNFDFFLKAHNLMQAGEVEAAKAIFAQLGWENGKGQGLGNNGAHQGLGKGMGKGLGHMINK